MGKAPLHVIVAGLRSIPEVEGGVESVAQQLYPAMKAEELDIEIVVRSPYYDRTLAGSWNGIRLTALWSPSQQGAEALLHSLLATSYAILKRPDVLHLHAIGPALLTPLARLFAIPVVVTHHGPDYEREKWGKAARAILRLGEWAGMRFANERIAISQTIASLVERKHGKQCHVIPNGVPPPPADQSALLLEQMGLQAGRYILNVGRFVPEKRQDDLIQAFLARPRSGWKLVFAGRDEGSYADSLKRLAGGHPDIHFAGFCRGAELAGLIADAGLFVLPSSHEGLPVALLEALSFGRRVLVSDIPAHLEVGLEDSAYFPLGNIEALADAITKRSEQSLSAAEAARTQQWTLERYNWDRIAEQTRAVYERCIES